MADYKRFISYMYIYKKGLKGNNIGYAKIEARNGTCKFTISVKCKELTVDKWNIALFYRGESDKDKRNINLINIETLDTEKEEVIVNYKTEEENLFSSNVPLSRIAGIILVGNNNEYIGTEWDDNGIDYKYVNNEIKENIDKISDDQDKKVVVNEENTNEEKSIQEVIDNKVITDKIVDSKIIDNNIENNNFIDSKIVKNKINDIENKNNEIKNKENKESKQYRENIQKSDIMNFNKFNESRVTNQRMEQKIKEESQDQIKPYIKRILDGYPGMYPFEDDEVIDCIKLEPHDIGVFPMDKWPLANNSFLLHGYYTYRHLIFARLKRNNNIHYILGVPGIFRDRERFMAKMFGFNNFKGVRNKPLNTGEFGYWYMYLNV